MAERIWIYPGSFDPFTLGHLAIVEQALLQAETVVIAILQHPQKKSYFTPAQKQALIAASVSQYPNVKVQVYTGLLADLYREIGATAIVRGVRNFRDWEYERDYALANQNYNKSCQFVYLPAPPSLTYVSSSLVRELLTFNKSIAGLVTDAAAKLIQTYHSN